jgi:serralysin
MATVTFVQATNMATLPTSFAGSGVADSTEIDRYDTAAGIQALCLGNFQFDVVTPYGTITHAYIDTGDFGLLPNLDITGLNFQLSTSFYNSSLAAGNLFAMVQALLAGNDTLVGSSGGDGMLGFDGDDTFLGGAGADAMDGGTGINTASYANAAASVFANLANPAANTGDAAGDTYASIQNLTGSRFNDTLVGKAGANLLDGGAGDDVLVGNGSLDILRGGPGNDTYVLSDGGDIVQDAGGIDRVSTTISRSLLAAGLTVVENLSLTGAAGINGTGNTLANLIIGNDAANTLDGGTGNDQLLGRGGNDVLIGGLGKDAMNGGVGTDLFRYAAASHSPTGANADVITDFDDLGDDRIDLSAVYGGTLAYRHNLAFTAIGQVRINDIAGADVIVEVNIAGGLAADMQIRLTATALAAMAGNDFFL